MSEPEEKIHVIPLGKDWEVEAESGAPLAHEDGKDAAVTVAVDLARTEGIETVLVHHGDGVTEAVTVPPALPPAGKDPLAAPNDDAR